MSVKKFYRTDLRAFSIRQSRLQTVTIGQMDSMKKKKNGRKKFDKLNLLSNAKYEHSTIGKESTVNRALGGSTYPG